MGKEPAVFGAGPVVARTTTRKSLYTKEYGVFARDSWCKTRRQVNVGRRVEAGSMNDNTRRTRRA